MDYQFQHPFDRAQHEETKARIDTNYPAPWTTYRSQTMDPQDIDNIVNAIIAVTSAVGGFLAGRRNRRNRK